MASERWYTASRGRSTPGSAVVHRCPLSHPSIDPCREGAVIDESPATQGNGAHVIRLENPRDDEDGIAAIVYGFDAFVSYGYVAGVR